MTILRVSAVILAVFIWAFAAGSVMPTLMESWHLGGPGARVASETIYEEQAYVR